MYTFPPCQQGGTVTPQIANLTPRHGSMPHGSLGPSTAATHEQIWESVRCAQTRKTRYVRALAGNCSEQLGSSTAGFGFGVASPRTHHRISTIGRGCVASEREIAGNGSWGCEGRRCTCHMFGIAIPPDCAFHPENSHGSSMR